MKPSNRLSIFLLDFTNILFTVFVLLTCYIFPSFTMWAIFIILFVFIMYVIIMIVYILEQIFKKLRLKDTWVSNKFFLFIGILVLFL